MKASSLRWGTIAPWGVFGLAMVWLTIYRFLQASGDDSAKFLVFLGILGGALCVVGFIGASQYRRTARSTRGLLAVLEEKYPGQAFAIFKTDRLQADVETLTPALRGVTWDKWTLYAVLTLDTESITIWDGSPKKPIVTARLDRSELRSIDPARDTALLFNVRALELAVSHAGVMQRVTVAPARAGDWIFFPATDSFTALESTLANSMSTPPAS